MLAGLHPEVKMEELNKEQLMHLSPLLLGTAGHKAMSKGVFATTTSLTCNSFRDMVSEEFGSTPEQP